MCKSPDPLIIVPFKIVVDLNIVLHCKFAHIGRDKELALVNTLVWHPQRYQVANEVCTTCPTCQINKYHPCVVVPPMLKIGICRLREVAGIRHYLRPLSLLIILFIQIGRCHLQHFCSFIIIILTIHF